ncbi:hypothetical protein EBU94_09025 [bacterium]|nr:hypothetical protein [bacterium]
MSSLAQNLIPEMVKNIYTSYTSWYESTSNTAWEAAIKTASNLLLMTITFYIPLAIATGFMIVSVL